MHIFLIPLHNFCLLPWEYPCQQTVFLSKSQNGSKLLRWLKFGSLLPVLFLHRACIHYYVSAHLCVYYESKSHFWQWHLVSAYSREFLMRTATLQSQHTWGVWFPYTWNLSQKGVDGRDSMYTNNLSESLARSPEPCSF